MHTRLCIRLLYVSIASYPAVSCEVLTPMHLAGVCFPLHFAVFVCATVPVHALELVTLCSQRSSVVHMCVDPSCVQFVAPFCL